MNLSKWIASVAMGASFMGAASPAGAWTRVENRTGNTINVAYAHTSRNELFCGYPTCGGQWASDGWFVINPGGVGQVNPNNFGNNVEHIFVMDVFGTRWQGNSSSTVHRVDFTNVFHFCGNPVPGNSTASFVLVRSRACCGGGCPSNNTWIVTFDGFGNPIITQ